MDKNKYVKNHRKRARKEHERMRLATLKRLGNKCSVCGTDKDLEIHHKIPYNKISRPHSWKYYNDANLELLCHVHHNDRLSKI